MPEYPEKELRMPIPESKRLGVQEIADLNERFESTPPSDVLAWVNLTPTQRSAGCTEWRPWHVHDHN